MLSEQECWDAVAARDRSFSGRFVLGVKTTGVYCRPGCPARLPKRTNVVFFAAPSDARREGFRACLRCRPDAEKWRGTEGTVERAMRLIEGGALAEGIDSLAERLGVGSRHLRRLFAEHTGVSPAEWERTRRLERARKMVLESGARLADIALDAGFGSVRRFNASFKQAFGAAPSALRGRH